MTVIKFYQYDSENQEFMRPSSDFGLRTKEELSNSNLIKQPVIQSVPLRLGPSGPIKNEEEDSISKQKTPQMAQSSTEDTETPISESPLTREDGGDIDEDQAHIRSAPVEQDQSISNIELEKMKATIDQELSVYKETEKNRIDADLSDYEDSQKDQFQATPSFH